jgi:hypothetical protein
MKLYGKNKKGKKIVITVPDWDVPVPNNVGQPAYDLSITSTSGSLS